MYTHNYDSSYDPAMPVVEIEIANIENDTKTVKLTGLVDSGSDTTLIPKRYLRALGIKRVRKAQIRGVSGFAYTVDMYMLQLKVGPYQLYGIRVAGDKKKIIIGRNVINQLVVTLNGLAEVTEVSN